MEIIKLVSLLLFISGVCCAQSHVGFLKPGTKPLHIKDIDYDCVDSTILIEKTYFEILHSDSSKFEIVAYCKHIHDSANADFHYSAYRDFIDSSSIVQFDNLPKKEKRRRITSAFDYFINILKIKKFDVQKIELAAESVYNPMRGEFAKYWLRTKDPALLVKWFTLLSLDGGSADEMQEETAAKLFCSAPDDFYNTLNKEPNKLKEYIVHLLTTGISYYVSNEQPIDGHADERANKYKDLLKSKEK